MIKISLILCLIHLLYYCYRGIIYQFVKIGNIYNTPNEEIFKLRSEFDVKIKTFRKEAVHWGFAWGNTIYLNELLLKVKKGAKTPYKTLRWIFLHEYFHLKHHFRKVILIRLGFCMVPMLLLVHWALFVIVYVTYAYVMYVVIVQVFEKQSDDYANKMIDDKANQ